MADDKQAAEIANRELEADIAAFAAKAHSTIQEARNKMSESERIEADGKATSIFARAHRLMKLNEMLDASICEPKK